MSGGTISTTITNSVTLGSAHYRSPLTITSTGEIDVIGVGVDIPAAETNGIVLNDGSIISQAVGVGQAAGSFYNAGLISAPIDGFLLSGGVLTNAGTIEGTTFGLSASGGSITNLAGGSISSVTIGVSLDGVASLTNDGTITATLYASELSGNAGMTNNGKITAFEDGVVLSGNASLTNNGEITAAFYGLKLFGSAGAVNYGTITADDTDGNYEAVVVVGGRLTNYASIYGTQMGVLLNGGTAENAGTVTSHSGPAVKVESGLLINTGSLNADSRLFNATGLLVHSGTVTNSGDISGRIGIKLYSGTVVNSGDVLAGGVVVSTNGEASIFVNYGSVYNRSSRSGYDAGITEIHGIVFNMAGAKIVGANFNGVDEGFGAHLSNAGSISGFDDGLSLGAGAYAVNSASGSISGEIGVSAGSATLINSGHISGSDVGVEDNGSTFTNRGSIYGGVEGLAVSGANYAVNRGDISGGNYGVGASSTTAFVNDGSVSGGMFGAVVEGLMTNAGDIFGQNFGAEVTSLISNGSLTLGTLLNSGRVSGTSGVDLIAGSVVNAGVISGTDYGVVLKGGALSNSGKIYGGKFGVEVFGGSLTNAGTIGGGTDAVYGVFVTLTVDPGAVFDGDVENAVGTSLLELAGTTAGSLSGIGGKIFGFTDISFASGSEWQLTGDKAGLATGQQINGFAQGDEIVFDGFAATSDSYVTGVGLVLADANGKRTLDITGSFSTGDFHVTTLGNNTTIALAAAPADETRVAASPLVSGSTISTTITNSVTLGSAHYRSPLTITSTGEITVIGVGVDIPAAETNGIVLNHGSIFSQAIGVSQAAGSFYNAGLITAAIDGFLLSGGVLSNAGSIAGANSGLSASGGSITNLAAGVISSDTIGVNLYGVASLTNDGAITATHYGAALSGSASLTNDAEIVGIDNGLELSGDARLTNNGDVMGTYYGLRLSGNASVVNYGTIVGNKTLAPRTSDGVVMVGGNLANYGSIYGVKLGVLLDGGTVENAGTVIGHLGVAAAVEAGLFINTGSLDASFNSSFTTPAGLVMNAVHGGTAANYGEISGRIGIDILAGTVTNAGIVGGRVEISVENDRPSIFINSGLVDETQFNFYEGILEKGGSVFNLAGGRIIGSGEGVVESYGAHMNNAGSIIGFSDGLNLDEASAINAASGSISGQIGVSMVDATLNNYGAISGSSMGVVDMTGVSHGGGALTNLGSIYGSSVGLKVSGSFSAVNRGDISSGFYGVQAYSTRSLVNFGSVSGGVFGAVVKGLMTNAGDIAGGTFGAVVTSLTSTTNGQVTLGTLLSSGRVSGNSGVDLIAGSVGNAGVISGTEYGVVLKSGSLGNSGKIYGGKFGVEAFGGSLTNAGTIGGETDAVYGVFVTLTVDPGAVFDGDVENAAGTSLLELAGTTAGSLSGIGGKIFGFTDISFASGSEWQLTGDKAGLATGQQINGFAQSDTIVFDGFAATSDSYVTGAGLVLADANGKQTLDITGSFSTGDFQVTTLGNNTTISLAAAPGADHVVMLDIGNGKAGAEMGFLSPAAAVAAPLGDHASNNFAALFSETRGANAEAFNYLPRLERINSRAPDAVATLAAHGISPAVLGLNGLPEHYVNGASIPLPGFEKL